MGQVQRDEEEEVLSDDTPTGQALPPTGWRQFLQVTSLVIRREFLTFNSGKFGVVEV